MLPKIKQWKNWSLPSKYTTIGLVVSLISLAFTIYALVQCGKHKEEILNIQSTISSRVAEIYASEEIDNAFHPNVNFNKQGNVISELKKVNNYHRKLSKIFNLGEVRRLLNVYGTEKQKQEFGGLINEVHHSTLDVTNFLQKLSKTRGPESQKQLSLWGKQYIELLNVASRKRAKLRGYVSELTPSEFGY